MKKILLIAFMLCGSFLQAQSIFISFKVIINPETGFVPDYTVEFNNIVRGMNDIISKTGRGIQFQIGEIQYIGGRNNQLVGQFYNVNPLDRNTDWVDELEHTARAYHLMFKWRENAINYYINNNDQGGACSFPSSRRAILSGLFEDHPDHYLHEIGHFFNLCHTHGCTTRTIECDNEVTYPGRDDGLDDTLPDAQCWNNYNDVALGNYGRRYENLGEYEQLKVRQAFNNVMAYHGNGTYLSPDQMDRFVMAMFDHENRQRVTSGLPIYTIWNGGCEGRNVGLTPLPCGYCEASPENQVQGLECAIEVSKQQTGRNTVVLWPWIYRTGPITISTPLTITSQKWGGDGGYSEIK